MPEDERSLLEFLDSPQLNCLNEEGAHTLKSLFSTKSFNTSSDKYLLSDVDEQLLLNIPFNQSVRVRSLIIKSSHPEQSPKTIKLFINKPSLGFEDVEDATEPEAAQIFELTEEQLREGKPIPLRYVRFQSVSSLHIFVATNNGDDVTRIDAIDVLGIPAAGVKDLSGLKKTEE